MHKHCHVHSAKDARMNRLKFAIYLNLLISVVQFIFGLYANSLSLLSDSLHNFSDTFALFFSLVAIKLTFKTPNIKQTFGYKRAEIVAAFFNSLTLAILAIFLIKEASVRLFYPQKVDSFWVITLAALSFFINIFCCFLLKKDTSNKNMYSAYLHLFSDALTSLAVVVSGICVMFTNLFWIDALVSLLISIYLFYLSFVLIKDTLAIIMHFVPPNLDIKEIEREILSEKKIKNIHHVHVWQLTDEQIHFEAHLDFNEDLRLSEASSILDVVRATLREKFKIEHTTLQAEINTTDDKTLIAYKKS